jgi:hypothetical protein
LVRITVRKHQQLERKLLNSQRVALLVNILTALENVKKYNTMFGPTDRRHPDLNSEAQKLGTFHCETAPLNCDVVTNICT